MYDSRGRGCAEPGWEQDAQLHEDGYFAFCGGGGGVGGSGRSSVFRSTFLVCGGSGIFGSDSLLSGSLSWVGLLWQWKWKWKRRLPNWCCGMV